MPHRFHERHRGSGAILGAYFAAWAVSYVVVMYNAVRRMDFAEYFHWLALAWTFRGFEMVAATWILSMVIFIPLAAAALFVMKRRTANKPERPSFA